MKLKFAIEDSDEIDSMESENLNVKPVSMMKKHSSTPAPRMLFNNNKIIDKNGFMKSEKQSKNYPT